MVTRPVIHHVNIVVQNLSSAVDRYRRALGLPAPVVDSLDDRGVLTARFDLGGIWLVLVQPTRDDGVPARHLSEHGEGLFLLSFAVDNLEDASARVRAAGARWSDERPRTGLDGWQVLDLEPADFCQARLQLTEI